MNKTLCTILYYFKLYVYGYILIFRTENCKYKINKQKVRGIKWLSGNIYISGKNATHHSLQTSIVQIDTWLQTVVCPCSWMTDTLLALFWNYKSILLTTWCAHPLQDLACKQWSSAIYDNSIQNSSVTFCLFHKAIKMFIREN